MNSEPAGCYSIVYSSTVIVDFTEESLLRLLRRARVFNAQAGITGVLMYGGGRFMQVLEGCPAAVRCLYARIATDPRHGRLEKLADGLVARREFTEWHMSFAPLPAGFPLPGYLTPPQLVIASAGTLVQPLLSEFMASCFEQVAA
ncbi:BLUF domain-containing protein [Hymenobacter sp. H14-R3]|uniref:BLUF domain-containing protein n=1 Tax=Hymenobacter sp. H14-R3 TaxID=3046308 RepID=UPI0024B8ACF8|nr:BLUF domain-containing protein [Hymenobacter sp. H14-R3]MDJ0364583.1 BLUF domain-containing protein [Hymenobacter sp. H14-R3]